MDPERVAAAVGAEVIGILPHGEGNGAYAVQLGDGTRAVMKLYTGDAHNLDVADTDVVHYDFSPYNIIASGDRITGVVDWDGATSGDAAFDLVTLATYTYDFGLRDELLAAAAASTAPRALALYAAHMVLRQVDWSLRHHDEATVEWFLGIGTALLDSVGAQ